MARRRLWLGAGTALAVFAVLTGVGVSQALWSDNATVSGTVKVASGNPALTVSGLSALVFTGQSSYVSTLTLTNTGDQTLSSFTAAVATGPTTGSDYDPNLAAHIAVTVWSMPSGGSCGMPPTSSPSGTWASWPSSPFPGLNLAAGASAQYCLLSTWDGTTTAGKQIYPALTINASSPAGAASANGALALQALAPINVTPSQLGVVSTDSVDTTVAGAGVVQTSSRGDSSPSGDLANPGTIITVSNFCTRLNIVGSGSTHDWSVKIDATKPPYYGTDLSDTSNVHFYAVASSYPGANSGSIVGRAQHFSTDPAGIYTITGVPGVDATHPFGSAENRYNWVGVGTYDVIHDTPIAAGQTAIIQFCIDRMGSPAAPQLDPSPTNYAITVQPRLVSCGANNYSPSATMSTTAPQNGTYDICLYTQITGYYPHFYIGWHYSVNWADVVNATYGSNPPSWLTQQGGISAVMALNPCRVVQYYQHTVTVQGQNSQSGTYGSNGNGPFSVTVTGTGASKTLTVSYWGITDGTGGITENMFVNSLAQTC